MGAHNRTVSQEIWMGGRPGADLGKGWEGWLEPGADVEGGGGVRVRNIPILAFNDQT